MRKGNWSSAWIALVFFISAFWYGNKALTEEYENRREGNKPLYNVNLEGECWSRTFGGPGEEKAHYVIPAANGGLLVLGHISEKGSINSNYVVSPWLFKLDASGDMVWEKSLGFESSLLYFKTCGTSGGGIVVADILHREAEPSSVRIRVVSIDDNGNEEWEQVFEEIGYSSIESISQVSDGGFIITGHKKELGGMGRSGTLVMKLDSSGTREWEYIFDREKHFRTHSVFEDEGDYMIAGAILIPNSTKYDFLVRRMGASGYLKEESRPLSGSLEQISSMARKPDGGYIFAGGIGDLSKTPHDVKLGEINREGEIIWSDIFGGEDGDSVTKITLTADGGFVALGNTKSFGTCFDGKKGKCHDARSSMFDQSLQDQSPPNIHVMKFDATGNQEWIKTLGGHFYDSGSDIKQTASGDYVITGYTAATDFDNDAWVIKLDADWECEFEFSEDRETTHPYEIANKQSEDTEEPLKIEVTDTIIESDNCWMMTFGDEGRDVFTSVAAGPDGDFAIGGTNINKSNSDAYSFVIEFDGSGNVQWENTVEEGWITALVQTKEGGYTAGGNGAGDNVGSVWGIRLDGDGNREWTETYKGEELLSIIQTVDGGFAIQGSADGFRNVPLVVKINSEGRQEWRKAIGYNDYPPGAFPVANAKAIAQAEDGGYMVAAGDVPMGADIYSMLVKLDSTGTIIWSRRYKGGYVYGPASIVATPSDEFVIVSEGISTAEEPGSKNSYISEGGVRIKTFKVDGNGKTVWNKYHGGNKYDAPKFVIQTSDGGYFIAGITRSFGTCFTENLEECDNRNNNVQGNEYSQDLNIWLLKLDSNGNKEWAKAVGRAAMDRGLSATELSDGNLIVVGETTLNPNNPNDVDAFIIKIDKKGKCDFEF